MEEELQHLSIKQWAEDDRPREKLLLKGKQALSDAELIAILLATGTRKENSTPHQKYIRTRRSGHRCWHQDVIKKRCRKRDYIDC